MMARGRPHQEFGLNKAEGCGVSGDVECPRLKE